MYFNVTMSNSRKIAINIGFQERIVSCPLTKVIFDLKLPLSFFIILKTIFVSGSQAKYF